MKHSINLYPQELRPRLEMLTVYTVLVAMGLSGLGLWGVNNYFVANNDRLTQEVRVLESEVSRKGSVLAIINAELNNRSEDPALLNLSNVKERELREKLQLFEALNQRDTLKTQSFADLMNTLAALPNRDLWLTNITVVGNDLVFHGMARNAEAVPQWVGALSAHDYFTGKRFSSANILRSQPSDEFLQFSLRTSDQQGG
jgi:MSHA biogenesis protein MshI